MALPREATISTFTKILTLEAASVAVSLYVITMSPGRLIALSYNIKLAPQSGWFRRPELFHMTIELDLPPRVHRSGHRISRIFVLNGTIDKTLQLVRMMV